MNIKLLRKIQKAILKAPDQFEMDWFFQSDLNLNVLNLVPAGGCGTAACIAGWAIHINNKAKKLSTTRQRSYGDDVWEVAKLLLQLDERKAENLLDQRYWPDPFKSNYRTAKLPTPRAKIAAERIDLFIKTNGAE